MESSWDINEGLPSGKHPKSLSKLVLYDVDKDRVRGFGNMLGKLLEHHGYNL